MIDSILLNIARMAFTFKWDPVNAVYHYLHEPLAAMSSFTSNWTYNSTNTLEIFGAYYIGHVVKFCNIVNCILLLAAITWITINMTVFGKLHNRWSFTSEKGKVYVTCFAAALVSFVTLVSDLPTVYIDLNDNVCELLIDIKTVLIGISITCIHFILWIRQYVEYHNAIMKPTIPRVIPILSYSSLVVISSLQ